MFYPLWPIAMHVGLGASFFSNLIYQSTIIIREGRKRERSTQAELCNFIVAKVDRSLNTRTTRDRAKKNLYFKEEIPLCEFLFYHIQVNR